MKEQDKYPDIELLKDRIINAMLIVGSILGSIAYISSLIASIRLGTTPSIYSDFFVVLSLITITIFRHNIRVKIKALVILVGLFLVVFTDLLNLGVLSDNKFMLIIIPFFTLMVFDLKRAYIVYFLGTAGVAVIAYLFISGIMIVETDYILRNEQLYPWIQNLIFITIVSFIILITVKLFQQTFFKLIDDLRNKNKEITQQEQSYREIFNSSADAIFIHNLEGEILDVNKAMLNTYGYSKEEVLGLTIKDLSSDSDEYTFEKASVKVKEAIDTGKSKFDWQAKKKSGEVFWVSVMLKKTVILGEKRILAVVTDINEKKKTAIELEQYKNRLEILVKERTEELESTNEELLATNEELYSQREELELTLEKLKSAQDKLIHSEKMASIGVLAAGVAHEINNPLNFIQGGAAGLEDLVERGDPFDEEARELLNAINEGIDRAADIVASLNHFSRQGDTKMENINIHNIINNCLVIINSQLKNKVEIVKHYADNIPLIKGNDGKLHQAFLNILTNAEQAINKKGTIKISTSLNHKNLLISIRDSGHGISKDNMLRITEPFFTTKEVGTGTGLGLSITYNILKEHGGSLEFSSEINEGTTVLVRLPLN
jgi:PAS domain S-box-containing protein